jgi:hypothetical protein
MRRIAIVVLALGLAGATGAAQAGVTPDEVKQRLEKAYPVQVLKVTPAEIDGKQAFVVHVMSKDTRGNGGFGVSTLTVDAETGQLLPAFRHETSGYTLPDTVSGDPREVNVPEHGFKTWR